MIVEYFKIDFLEARDKYNCCFTEKDFQTEMYDFWYSLIDTKQNLDRYEELLRKYNCVQILLNGFLISNKYMMIDYKKIPIIPVNRTYGRSKVLTDTYAIRFMKRFQKEFIHNNLKYYKEKHVDKYLPTIRYISNNILIEDRIFYDKQFQYHYKKLFFVFYLIFVKHINLMDLIESNIIYTKDRRFKIIDVDCSVKIPKKLLIPYYLNEYIFVNINYKLWKKIDDWLNMKINLFFKTKNRCLWWEFNGNNNRKF